MNTNTTTVEITSPKNQKVECLLRIENPEIAFNRDIRVDVNPDLLRDDSWKFEDIYTGASQTLLQKYLAQMKLANSKISFLRPIELDKDKFIAFLEDADTNKAKADINNILASLPEDKRAIVLQSLRDK